MAFYNESAVLKYKDDEIFNMLHKPADTVPSSGIYRCVVCGREVCCNAGDPLPPQNHHQHCSNDPIRWKLIVLSKG